jgi:hypothetical protein
MRFIENEKDYGRYHGHQYCRISFDEVTEYPTNGGFLKMLSCLRSPHGIPCTVRLTGNPGGIGHVWVKARYVDVAPPLTPYKDPETGFVRMFVPSKMAHNQHRHAGRPGLQEPAAGGHRGQRGAAQGLVRRRLGHRGRRVLRQLAQRPARGAPLHPAQALDARQVDGLGQLPPVLHRLVVHRGGRVGEDGDGTEQKFPAGALIRYREWYGVERDQSGASMPNVG